ncbi:Lipopolysaccharide export system permease protein LptF [wastewater metagenome]|uniref:Lipopolysaccharide export system permease protein LptF n=2 Tax=unclassified sequences TaxID=12908 RepID=A0A5B8R9I6_9ZZZZ|nr:MULTISPECIES: LPS export ABC transporter permease LptF [Arhodomonas]MCS4505179.1 LPS export ABC transporter permease LptF [Arhodomonas aquaeolei]QEA05446.1 lipopolysaccharide export system permease protein LptF [uncultured organism]
MLRRRLERYLVRETLLAWGGVTLVLVVVLLTNRLIKFMAAAARGEVPAELIFGLLGLKALANLGMVLPASLFLAVILALGRLYRDSEMAAMTACGFGPRHILSALMTLAVPLSIFVAVFSISLGPQAEATAQRLVIESSQRSQFQGLEGGRFLTLDGGGAVYAGAVADDGTLRDVFARLPGDGVDRVIVADSAYRRTDPDTGGRFLVLVDGWRYDGSPGLLAWRMLSFKEHGIRLDARAPVKGHLKRDARSVPRLLAGGERADYAELQWRLGMAVSVFTLILAAIPLARTAPREGRYAKLVGAVLLYVVYFNGLKVAQDWYESGTVPGWLGLWWVHAALGVFAVAMLVREYGLRRRPS